MGFFDDLFETIGEGVDKARDVFDVVKEVGKVPDSLPAGGDLPQGAPPREEEPHRLERSQIDTSEQPSWLMPVVVLVAVVAVIGLSKG